VGAILVENLKKYFGKTHAVDGISFSVDEGEIFGYLGPNGAGKTTTIRCMMDFLRPDEGRVEILGLDSHKDSTSLKAHVGFLSGEVSLYGGWTGREHIDFFEDLLGVAQEDDGLVKQFGFDPSKKVKNLSTGNKQKLGLILALMHQPKLLILDEPTLGLDPLLQNSIHEILKKEAQKGRTIFMSSHNLSEVEKICDRVCVIKEGKIATVETISAIKEKRLYTIHVYFEDVVPKSDFAKDKIEIIKELEGGLSLRVRGDIKPVLTKLSRYNLKDLEITHANLEEVFMEFYR
jgi:ABC-2 type transport system ATP-binding protein